MKVLVCGGRDYHNKEFLYSVLDEFHKEYNITLIIAGDARGADEMAINWASDTHLHFNMYIADWEAEGKAAGVIRNQRMIDEGRPDFVIAFPGGKGTQDMIDRTIRAKIHLINFNSNNLETMHVHP